MQFTAQLIKIMQLGMNKSVNFLHEHCNELVTVEEVETMKQNIIYDHKIFSDWNVFAEYSSRS